MPIRTITQDQFSNREWLELEEEAEERGVTTDSLINELVREQLAARRRAKQILESHFRGTQKFKKVGT